MATALRLVETSEAGRTQRELQLRLGVRVHNPLLELVERKRLRREAVEDEYVYVAGARARAAEQLARRRVMPEAPVSATLELEVLLEVIHVARLPVLDAQTLAARLSARGVRASVGEVTAVLARHGLQKKIARPPIRVGLSGEVDVVVHDEARGRTAGERAQASRNLQHLRSRTTLHPELRVPHALGDGSFSAPLVSGTGAAKHQVEPEGVRHGDPPR